MIEVDNLTYSYPKKQCLAIDNLSFSVKHNHVLTILGQNGAGKTTLIRILSNLILPTQGRINICGIDLLKYSNIARRKIGLVIGDERTFYFRLSGKQNLEFFGGLYGLQHFELKSRIKMVLDDVGLTEHANVKYMRYSTGMKKRLSIARALLHRPEVYLLDEPNSGVDPNSAKKIRTIIKSLKDNGKAIILTTHDMNEAEKLSDSIGYLKNGSLINQGSLDEFKKLITHHTFRIRISDEQDRQDIEINMLLELLKKEDYCKALDFQNNVLQIKHNGSFNINRVFEVINRTGIKVSSANSIEPSLEDVFIKLSE
ncbi:MAG: ABC transporter ATP-binding protein [Candidatus Zixiibacteriota bacterium]